MTAGGWSWNTNCYWNPDWAWNPNSSWNPSWSWNPDWSRNRDWSWNPNSSWNPDSTWNPAWSWNPNSSWNPDPSWNTDPSWNPNSYWNHGQAPVEQVVDAHQPRRVEQGYGAESVDYDTRLNSFIAGEVAQHGEWDPESRYNRAPQRPDHARSRSTSW